MLEPAGLQVLRRTWLWWARHASAPNAMRTGRWAFGDDGGFPDWWAQGQRLVEAWRTMVEPPPKGSFQLPAEGVLRRWRGAWWPGEWVAYQEAVRRRPPEVPRGIWLSPLQRMKQRPRPSSGESQVRGKVQGPK